MSETGDTLVHMIVSATLTQATICNFLQAILTEVGEENLAPYASKVNFEGQAPLHIAIETEQRDTCKLLVEKIKVDVMVCTSEGLGVIHIAGATGNPTLLAYFLSFDWLNSTDRDGRTPLHLASQNGKDLTATLLISRGCAVNAQDQVGQTPLHYAALTMNVRLIRALIIAGANRKAVDSSGQTPLQVSEGDSQVSALLREPTFFQRLNKLKPALGSGASASFGLKLTFYSLWGVRYLIFLSVVAGALPLPFLIPSIFIGFTMITLYTMLQFTNPGFALSSSDTLMSLYQIYKHQFVWPFCEIRRGHGTKHCATCKHCVKGYDHHCPWLGIWIGRRNILRFRVFLIFLELDFLWVALVSFLHVVGVVERVEYAMYEEESNYIIALIAVSVILGVTGFVVMFPLLYVTMSNWVRGITTYERFAFKGESRPVKVSRNETITESMYQSGADGDLKLQFIDFDSAPERKKKSYCL